MEYFTTLFGPDFDFDAFEKGAINPAPVDTPENLRLLSTLQSAPDVSSMHVKIGEEMAGRSVLERNLEGEALREKGNSLYKEGKIAEALEVYTEAITINPFDVRLFTNAAICLINLNKNEEAITICSIATDVQPQCTKAHLLSVRASCNLGFVQEGEAYAQDTVERLPMSEWRDFLEEANKLVKDVPKSARRPLDKRELERTKKRLLSNEERGPEVYNYLLLHLKDLCESFEDMSIRVYPTFLKALTETPYISAFFKDPLTRINSLTAGEYRLLGSFIQLLQLICEDNFEMCEKLLAQPVFIPFLSNLGRALAKRSTLQSVFSQHGPGYVFPSFFSTLVYMLATLGKYPAVKNKLYKETAPFDDLSFYVHLMAIYPGIFDTMDSPDTNMFVDVISAILVESWFLDKLEQSIPSPRVDHAISMLATLSTIFLQSRSAQYRLEKPPFASFLPFWLKMSGRPKIAAVLARRPGVWHHFATRLRYATRDLERFLGQMHHRDHLEETLKFLKNLTQQKLESPAIFDEDPGTRDRLLECLTSLLDFREKCSTRLSGFVDLTCKYALQILKRMFESSPKFASSFLSNKQQPGLQKIASFASNPGNLETSSAGLACFSTLVKSATSTHVCQFVSKSGKKFGEFIQRLVDILGGAKTSTAKAVKGKQEESSEIISNEQLTAIEILRTLIAVERDDKENDPLFKALLASNPQGLFEAVAGLIRNALIKKEGQQLPSTRDSIEHLPTDLLLDLISASPALSDFCRQMPLEFSCSTLIAIQEQLKQTSEEEERKKLENLVSILSA